MTTSTSCKVEWSVGCFNLCSVRVTLSTCKQTSTSNTKRNECSWLFQILLTIFINFSSSFFWPFQSWFQTQAINIGDFCLHMFHAKILQDNVWELVWKSTNLLVFLLSIASVVSCPHLFIILDVLLDEYFQEVDCIGRVSTHNLIVSTLILSGFHSLNCSLKPYFSNCCYNCPSGKNV